MPMPHQFLDLRLPEVLAKVTDRSAPYRWAILVGQREEPLYEYLRDELAEYPGRNRWLSFGVADTWFGDDGNSHPELRQFLEEHMVSSTPSILLVRKGQQEALISGAVPRERLHKAIDEMCSETAKDRLDAALAEMADNADLSIAAARYVQVGVDANGEPLYKQVTDAGEAPSV